MIIFSFMITVLCVLLVEVVCVLTYMGYQLDKEYSKIDPGWPGPI